MHVVVDSGEHVHDVTMGSVTYGSVNGVCGSRIASVVPTRAIASLSISAVDLSTSSIDLGVKLLKFEKNYHDCNSPSMS